MKIKRKLLKLFSMLNPFSMLIYILSGWVKKDKKLWIFGAWQGKLYADNSKYLFRYMNRHHPEIRCVWVSLDPNVADEVKREGYEAYLIRSMTGRQLLMKAGVVFMTEGNRDIGGYMHRNALQIQLWHGMGIKDVRTFHVNSSRISKFNHSKLTYAHKEDYWMTCSQEAVDKYSKAFEIDTARMFITGQPKDDTFVQTSDNAFVTAIRVRHPGCKIFVYLPTHRGFGKHQEDQMLSYETLTQVNGELAKRNLVMIFKPHFHEFKNYTGKDLDFGNIIFATDVQKFGDVYEFLPSCDGLISDYSGIMLGYLTADKPIVYFPYDQKLYDQEDMGLYYDYQEVTAGQICYTWDEVINSLHAVATKDEFAQERAMLRKRFSPFKDGENSKRIYQQVMVLLG